MVLSAHVLGGKKPESEYVCICMHTHTRMYVNVDTDRLGCCGDVILFSLCPKFLFLAL